MPAGRPRTVSLPPEEMEKLGQEMVDWIKSHPETLHLSEWYTIEKMYIYKQWKAMIQIPEFLPYYEVALKIIGKKYLDKTSNVREGISQRWQRSYFADIKEREDEDADMESERRKKETGAFQGNITIKVHDGLGSGIKVSTPTLSTEVDSCPE